ncbi:MAG: 5'-nucleotidase C-terminal domain-containing protein, partial [Lachnospiraceae bacterium]|nr:5'-nucleotidase C-terminal domain-containing protein [Lachnospiraceae bacterium]
ETVKIGITGAVTPDLGTFSDWKEDVKTEEILDSVRAEVKKLKKSGADIVIVLSHSGIGDYHYPTEENAANVSYRVALIDGVYMVCAGHTHVDFPSKTSKAANTFDYPQTDENGLVNGTILVQEEDHAASLGISDIKFAFKNGKAIVKSKKGRVYRIQDSDEEDTEVLKINKFYDEQAKEIYDRALLESEETRNNYFGMLEDNALIQITNEAKIAYGKKIVKEKKQEYMGYPVISSTAYELTGQNGSDDYIKTSGSVTLRDLLNVQMWGQKYAKVYYMTGAQLRECIEWSAASAFATQPYAGSSVWQDEEYNQYADIGFSPVLSPEWEDWTGFTVFDGVEYTIDVTKPPRYDRSGFHIINDSHRIKSLTCNGEAVQDDDIFIWVGYMTTNTWPPVKKQIVKQAVLGKQEPVSDIVTAYISEQSEKGSIILECDNNWRVEFPEAENYLLKSSAASKIVAVAKDWYVDCLKELNGYAYYQARLSASYEDTAGPLLVLAQIDSDASGDEVRIAVQTSDSSNISFIKYAEGSLAADDSAWNDANSVEGGILKVDKNGVYSVMAVDTCGNRTVKIITITNIDKTLATTPEVKQCKNTSAKVVGTASPKGKVYVEAKSGIYETEAEDDGSFSCAVVHLKSDEVIRVWQIDTLGRISEKKEVTVKRSGANAPDVDKINNKKSSITGVLEDSVYCKVVAIRGSSVYIPKGQKEAYKETKIYKNNEEKNIVETEFELDHFTKRFRLAVPKLYSNQKIKVYSYDWLCRSSTLTNIIVEDVAPNQPRLSKVIAQEGCVYGYIPNPQKDISYLVTAKCDGEEYEGKTDENGFFAISMGVLDVKKSVKVMASDTGKNGETRESLSASTQTIDFNDLEDVDFSNGYIEPLTNKTTVVTGYVNKLPANGLYLVYGGVRHLLSVDENGDFRYVLTRTRKAGSRVGLLSRNIDGSWQTFR